MTETIENGDVVEAVTETVEVVEQEQAPEYQAAPAGYSGPQSPDFSAYPQPTDYPGFAAGS